MKSIRRWVWYGSIGLLFFIHSGTVTADPLTKVARLNYISGNVSFAPAGVNDWVSATLNRPLTLGDRLWSDNKSRAEFQLENAVTRIGNNTSINILNLDNNTAQFGLNQGHLNLRIWKIKSNQTYEINTPNLAFTTQQSGNYRIDINDSAKTTTVSIYNGKAVIYGEKQQFVMKAGQSCLFKGTQLQDHRCSSVLPPDDFERWGADRDKHAMTAMSSHHLSHEIIGFEDLEIYGKWKKLKDFGEVWTPTQVTPDWAPYQNGRWAWISPWGWTWIGAESWGFAPFHYGRWLSFENVWYWAPGSSVTAPIYTPALVAFINNFPMRIKKETGIAWFPLGLSDVYMPSYAVSENYFVDVNFTNTILKKPYIKHVYNKPFINFNLANQHIPHAMTSALTVDFLQGKPAQTIKISPRIKIANNSITTFVQLTPTINSVLGTIELTNNKPLKKVLDKELIVKTLPPKRAINFVEQKTLLAKNPGKPLTVTELETLKPRSKETLAHFKLVKLIQPNKLFAMTQKTKMKTLGGQSKSIKMAKNHIPQHIHSSSKNQLKSKTIIHTVARKQNRLHKQTYVSVAFDSTKKLQKSNSEKNLN